jgi:AbrB family looped-hinge helix DNA binding protein
MKTVNFGKSFLGMTTLGEKGQVVVPADARKAMKLEKGEKLLVFSIDENILVLSKTAGMEKFAAHLKKQLRDIDAALKNKKNN